MDGAGDFDGDRAFETVRTLSGRAFAGRRVATAGHERARRWIEARLTGWGYEIGRHPFRYPTSIVDVVGSPTGSASTRRIASRRLTYRRDFAEHPASAANRRPLSGAVVRWNRDTNFRNRWVVSSADPGSPPLGQQIVQAAARDAIGFLIPFSVPRGGVIFKQLPAGAPFPLPTFFLRQELLNSEWPTEIVLDVRVRRLPLTGMNLLAEVAGSDRALAHQPLLLGAHYDAVGDDPDGRRFPGASDNASGVAVVLEVARALREHQVAFPRPVWIAAFDAEETGAYGAHALAAEFRHSGISPIVVNLDLSALADSPVVVEGSANSLPLFRALDVAAKRIGVPLAHGAVQSDNRQFAAVGFPSVGLGSGGRGYHTPSDGPGKVQPPALARSGALLLAAIDELAG